MTDDELQNGGIKQLWMLLLRLSTVMINTGAADAIRRCGARLSSRFKGAKTVILATEKSFVVRQTAWMSGAVAGVMNEAPASAIRRICKGHRILPPGKMPPEPSGHVAAGGGLLCPLGKHSAPIQERNYCVYLELTPFGRSSATPRRTLKPGG